MQNATVRMTGETTRRMDTLYDQLIQLQRIPHAYVEWTAYRNALTDFVLAHTKEDQSVVIIGAGECNDFDLCRMSDHFSQILLLDHQEDAMRAGLKRQKIDSARIRPVRADLLGITDDTYRAMCDVLLFALQRQLRGEAGPEVFERLFLEQMHSAFSSRKPSDFLRQEAVVDYCICCGVHSQLINIFPQMAGIYKNYIHFNQDAICKAARSMNTVIAQELNACLLRLSGTGVILGLEKCRLGMDGGIEGAVQGLLDIQSRNVTIAETMQLLWPFDRSQNKIYETELLYIQK